MSISVKLPYDPVWRPLEWAKKYCPSYITNMANTETVDRGFYARELVYSIEYYFGDEQDATAFKLKWG